MIDERKKDKNWVCADVNGAVSPTHATLAVLMDIRDEMKELNRVFRCQNFLDMLRKIRANTTTAVRLSEEAKRK